MVIEEIARAGVPVTPTDVNAAIGLPKPTIHRLFATLEEEGFLQRDMDGRTYSPGPRLRTGGGRHPVVAAHPHARGRRSCGG